MSHKALNALAKVISSNEKSEPTDTRDSKQILSERLVALAQEMRMTAGMIDIIYEHNHENSLQLKGASAMVDQWAEDIWKKEGK